MNSSEVNELRRSAELLAHATQCLLRELSKTHPEYSEVDFLTRLVSESTDTVNRSFKDYDNKITQD